MEFAITVFIVGGIAAAIGMTLAMTIKGWIYDSNQDKRMHHFQTDQAQEKEREALRLQRRKQNIQAMKEARAELKKKKKEKNRLISHNKGKEEATNIDTTASEPKPRTKLPEKKKTESESQSEVPQKKKETDSLLKKRGEDKDSIGYVDFVCENEGEDTKSVIKRLSKEQDARYGIKEE